MKLQDKVAIVTGAGNGIGRAAAIRLAEEGATVVVVDIEEQSAATVVDRIVAAGGRALSVHADVGLGADIERMAAITLATYGRIDILHNNAAWYPTKAAIETSEEEWDRTMAVSLKSAWLGARAVLPAMPAAGSGCIVNTASIHGLIAFRRHTAYDTAKAGLIGLTRSLALDYAPTVRVNAVVPGGVDTRLWDHMSPTQRQTSVAGIPLQRLATPEEIAEGVLFLVSDGAAFMTGACLVMDGGRTIL
jgi:NAD(P)-dependent dehydrogenase (short-subunit alcohol dehydrogenase family)